MKLHASTSLRSRNNGTCHEKYFCIKYRHFHDWSTIESIWIIRVAMTNIQCAKRVILLQTDFNIIFPCNSDKWWNTCNCSQFRAEDKVAYQPLAWTNHFNENHDIQINYTTFCSPVGHSHVKTFILFPLRVAICHFSFHEKKMVILF
jgi:hypothetical protein